MPVVALQTPWSVFVEPVQEGPAPQVVVGPLLVVSLQAIVPVAHEVVPFLQGLVGWQG